MKKVVVFFGVIFFVEPIFYLKLLLNNGNLEKYKFYQTLSDFVSENMFFCAIGIVIFTVDRAQGIDFSLTLPISVLFSYISTISTIIRLYYLRI